MNVLSLFDGMSCGQIALRELGIIPDRYYASEIDRYAIAQTRLNFPDTIQLGDVERWREWNIDWASIDLILAGSPCQGFSFAGKMLAFDDPRSRLFFVFADILDHVRRANPGVRFLLENVKMKKKHLRIISKYVGVWPVLINSALVSAQNRERYYWTDIRVRRERLFGEVHTDIPQPGDEGIVLADILEDEPDEKYYLGDKMVRYVTDPIRLKKMYTAIDGDKALCLMGKSYSSWAGTFISRPHSSKKQDDISLKAPQLTGNIKECNNVIVHNMMGRSSKSGRGGTGHLTRNDGKTYCLDTSNTNAVEIDQRIRRLTPTECDRLQTIPAWYRWSCSDTQHYKMLGNGWTVRTIMHILSFWPRIAADNRSNNRLRA